MPRNSNGLLRNCNRVTNKTRLKVIHGSINKLGIPHQHHSLDISNSTIWLRKTLFANSKFLLQVLLFLHNVCYNSARSIFDLSDSSIWFIPFPCHFQIIFHILSFGLTITLEGQTDGILVSKIKQIGTRRSATGISSRQGETPTERLFTSVVRPSHSNTRRNITKFLS